MNSCCSLFLYACTSTSPLPHGHTSLLLAEYQPITSPQNSICTSMQLLQHKPSPMHAYAMRPSTHNTNWENDAWWAIAAWEYFHSLLLQAQHSFTAWTVGMRLGVSVNNIKQCLSLWLSYIPHTVCHEGLDFPRNISLPYYRLSRESSYEPTLHYPGKIGPYK